MRLLVLSTSVDPDSRSRLLAHRAMEHLLTSGHGDEIAWLDAAELDLPLCDGGSAWSHPGATALKEALQGADGVLLAMGIYNYNLSAATKTAIELGADAWEDKVVALAVASGGTGSYMACMSAVRSLMLDWHCVIVPRFVHASNSAFGDGAIVEPDVDDRLGRLAEDLARITAALGDASRSP